jgi:ketosteroid isomerase-like protein
VTESLDPFGDQWEIRQVIERYANAVDRSDGESAAALFADDGVFEIWLEPGASAPTSTRRGPSEIATAINGLRGNYLTQHVIANSVVDVGEEVAHGQTQCTAHHVKLGDAEPHDDVMHLTYDESLARIEGHWRFTRRVLRARWTATRPVESL